MSTLRSFTEAAASGLANLKISIRSMLPSLYVYNQNPSDDSTPLVYDGDFPNRLAHSYAENLELLGYMFDVTRNLGESDEALRRRILFSIGENSTISGIENSIVKLFEASGLEVGVKIRESFSDFFDGTSNNFSSPMRNPKGSMLYGITIYIYPSIETKRRVSIFNYSTLSKNTINYPLGVSWEKVSIPSGFGILESFREDSLRDIIQVIVASGVRVDRVVLVSSDSKEL